MDAHQRGADVHGIAALVGCTVPRAAALLAEGIAALPAQDVDDLRTGTEVRLNLLARVYGSMLDDEDVKVRLAGANGMLAVERERSKLLGLALRPPTDKEN